MFHSSSRWTTCVVRVLALRAKSVAMNNEGSFPKILGEMLSSALRLSPPDSLLESLLSKNITGCFPALFAGRYTLLWTDIIGLRPFHPSIPFSTACATVSTPFGCQSHFSGCGLGLHSWCWGFYLYDPHF